MPVKNVSVLTGVFFICPVCDARKATAINRRDGAFREVLRDLHVFHLAAQRPQQAWLW